MYSANASSRSLANRPQLSGHARIPGGFTLVELLVVMSIIAILAGLSMTAIMYSGESGRISSEETRLQNLIVYAKNYETEHGDYPPSSLADFGVKGANKTNDGIEAFYAALQTRRHGGPFIDDVKVDERSNTDKDKLSATQLKKIAARLDWTREGNQIFELTDLWGNPYVYIHSNDYKTVGQLQNSEGKLSAVRAVKDPDTGGYVHPTSFQIWSLGPNGVNDNGGEDDICSWKR